MKIVRGTHEVEYMPLLSGDEIDVDVFRTSKTNLEKAGFQSGEQFFDYIMSCSPKTVVGSYIPDDVNDEGFVHAREFQRCDGYSTVLKVGGCMYGYY